MQITQVSTERGGSLQAPGERQILTPVGTPPRRLFRSVLFLRFTTGSSAEKLIIETQDRDAQFEANFLPLEYDALTVSESTLAATVSRPAGGDDAVIIALDAPRRVVSIRIAETKVSSHRHKLEIYRLDGDAIAPNPTVTATNGPGKSITVGFQSRAERQAFTLPGPFHVDFTDVRFALRLKDPQCQPIHLDPTDLAEIQIHSEPANPRVGLAFPPSPASLDADPATAVFFWPIPTGGSPPIPDNVEAGGPLASALSRAAASFADQRGSAALPAAIEAALVIESDAPCRLHITGLSLTYHLSRSLFAPDATGAVTKQVLRFDGNRFASQQLLLHLPPRSTIMAATLKTVESFPRGATPSGDSAPARDTALPMTTGILIDGSRSVAQSLTPATAITVSGAALGLLGAADPIALQVEIQEDAQGQPSGKRLAVGTVTLSHPGQPEWVTARFPQPVILSTATCWLVLSATRGQAVWLTRESDPEGRLLAKRGPKGEWSAPSEFGDRKGVQELVSPVAPAVASSPVELRVGGQPIPGTPDGVSGARRYELAVSLNAPLATPSAPREVPLTVTATSRGLLTLSPPQVVYDL